MTEPVAEPVTEPVSDPAPDPAGPTFEPTAQTGTGPVRSVLHAVQEQAGATFLEDSGWLWTSTLGDPVAEYQAVRTSAGMWDVYPLQKWHVRGRDAARAVQRTFTADVSTLAVGQVRYGPFVDPSGAMVDDGTVYKHADDYFWVMTNGTQFDQFLAEHTTPAAITDYTISNHTTDMPVISVQGPASRRILQELTDTDLAGLRYFRFLPQRQQVAGVPVWVLRTGFSGELGFELIPDPEQAVQLWTALGAAGVRPFGLDAVEMLRVEAGLVIAAVDYEPGQTSPYDLSMDALVALGSDVDFVGKQALAQVAAHPPRRFRTLLIDGDQVPEYGAPVHDAHAVVGTCTSPVLSPSFGVIALAVLATGSAAGGTVVQVPVGDGTARAVVTDLSVHDPGKTKPRS